MIPQSFIQELLARVDIVDVVERYLPLKKAGANYKACCPFHGEKTPSFTVSQSKQFYHCFGCGANGSALGFVMEYQGLPFPEAVEELARQVGMAVPRETETPAQIQQRERAGSLHEIMAEASRYYREQLKHSQRAIDYLKRRGLTGQVAQRFGLGYAPADWQNLQAVFPDYAAATLSECGLVIDSEATAEKSARRYDRFRDRVMFPILDVRGKVIGFGGRIIDNGEPKYLNSPETPLFEKGRELYGLVQARQSMHALNQVIVVEGYMDVVALAQYGVENAVATLGTATTPVHVQKLLRQVDEVVFCFDGDRAGRKAAWRALEACLEQLQDGKRVRFLFLAEEHDPDSFVREAGAEAFRALAAKSPPLTSVLLSELSERCDLSTLEGRTQLVTEVRPLLQKLQAPIMRAQLVHALAQASQLDAPEIERLCALAKPANIPMGSGYASSHAPSEPPPYARDDDFANHSEAFVERVRVEPSRDFGSSRRGTTFRGRRRDARPVRMPVKPPASQMRHLLRLVLQHPTWSARLPLAVLSEEEQDDDSGALLALADAVDHGEISGTRFEELLEYFRGTAHEGLLSELCAEMIESGETHDASQDEAVFADAIRRLEERANSRQIAALRAEIGQNSPNSQQRQELDRLLKEKQSLASRALAATKSYNDQFR